MNMLVKIDASSPVPLRFGVADFMRLANEGMFEDYAKTELIEGEIFVVNALYRPHAWALRQLVRAFDAALAGRDDGLTALHECSVELLPNSMPEPDVTLTTEPRGDGPIPLASVKLVIEISDTTLASDLGRKVALYATHAVPEYWVVDLEGRVVHQMWEPMDKSYGKLRKVGFGQKILATTLTGVSFETAELI